MWNVLAKLPAMGDTPEKRQRNSKFDSRHRHRHAGVKRGLDAAVQPELEHEEAIRSEGSFLGNLFNLRRDPLSGAGRHGRIHGHLQQRQVTVEVSVTLASTAVVSIGVDANGNPTATATTTLPAGTPSDATVSSTSTEPSSSPSSTLSSTGATSSTLDSSTTSSASPPASSDSSTSSNISSTLQSASGSVSAAAADASSQATPSTTEATSSSLTTTSAEPATTPSTNAALATTASSTPSSTETSQTSTTSGATSGTIENPTTTTESSGFASLLATNGTTTSGLSLTTSNIDSLTAAGASTTAGSLTNTDASASNGTIAVAHTKHSGSSSATGLSAHSTLSDHLSSTLASHRSSSTRLRSGTGSATDALTGIGGATATDSGAPGATGGTGADSSLDTNQDSTVAPPATIAGSVVGSVAGVALIVAVLFFLFRRWHRQRALAAQRSSAARQLGVEDPFSDPPGSGAMTQRSSNAFFSAAAMGGLFNRASRHAEPVVPPEQRGFQKVSGRKLPSAFSPGMEAVPVGAAAATLAGPAYDSTQQRDIGVARGPENPFHSPTNSDDSTTGWYRDDVDSFGGATAVPPDTGSTGMTHFVPGMAAADYTRERYPSSAYSADTSATQRPYKTPDTGLPTETLLPSPARTPIIQKPSPFGRTSSVPAFGPGGSPPRADFFGSSSPGYDSRGSRFTEGIP